MAGLNKVEIIGNLGGDPEVRYTANGGAVANITLATSETWKDAQGNRQEKTEWHRVVFFGKVAEIAGEYLRKGSQCYVCGKLQTRKWQDQGGQDRYTTEIVVDGFDGRRLLLLGGRQANDNAPAQGNAQQPQQGKGKPYQRPVERYGSAAPNPMANEPAQQQMPDYDSIDDDVPF